MPMHDNHPQCLKSRTGYKISAHRHSHHKDEESSGFMLGTVAYACSQSKFLETTEDMKSVLPRRVRPAAPPRQARRRSMVSGSPLAPHPSASCRASAGGGTDLSPGVHFAALRLNHSWRHWATGKEGNKHRRTNEPFCPAPPGPLISTPESPMTS